jgi:PAS domain-containing protein
MPKVCGFCETPIAEGEPATVEVLTYGMCQECFRHFLPQWKGQSFSEYLDRFEFPVFVTDDNVRIIAANQAMCRQLGIEKPEAVGLLGGRALECLNARLPGGCGKTDHCETCAIRNTVARVYATGHAVRDVPATLVRTTGTVRLLISAEREKNAVKVTVRPAAPDTPAPPAP